MNVLHLNNTDYFNGGGCAIAMHRLHDGLRRAEVDSKILCWEKTTPSSHCIRYRPTKRWRRIDAYLKHFTDRFGLYGLNVVSSFSLGKQEAIRQADILNLHGVWNQHFNYLALPALSRIKPTVIVLHDMRPFTGHCAFSYDCSRYATGCGRCPYPQNYPAIPRDFTHAEWKIKKWMYARSKLTIVCLSTHQKRQVEQSILKDFPLRLIHHGIDTGIFRPLDRNMCRHLLGIPEQKKVILFSALSLNQHNKGGDLLIAAIDRLAERYPAKYLILTFGKNELNLPRNGGIDCLDLGYVTNDRFKAVIYSAADIFVSPTRAESFSLVTLESIACGTPVVAFGIGGIPDIIQHGVNGYVAEPENVEDLFRGICELTGDENHLNKLSENGRKLVEDHFSLESQVQQYLSLYRETCSLCN